MQITLGRQRRGNQAADTGHSHKEIRSEGRWLGRKEYSHLIPLLIIGQDLGHVPVPGSDGLDVVITAVGLKHTDKVNVRTGLDPLPLQLELV